MASRRRERGSPEDERRRGRHHRERAERRDSHEEDQGTRRRSRSPPIRPVKSEEQGRDRAAPLARSGAADWEEGRGRRARRTAEEGGRRRDAVEKSRRRRGREAEEGSGEREDQGREGRHDQGREGRGQEEGGQRERRDRGDREEGRGERSDRVEREETRGERRDRGDREETRGERSREEQRDERQETRGERSREEQRGLMSAMEERSEPRNGGQDRHTEEDTTEYEYGGKAGDDNKVEEKPNFGLSGKLTAETNTYRGVVINYREPPEARQPRTRWRLYPFKGDETLPTLFIHRQTAYLIGRDRRIVDVPIDHPSCSKQHAVLQYRLVDYEKEDGTAGKKVKPYIIDLESTNGTYVNNQRVESARYVELKETDMIKFGFSSREYVLLHENSKGLRAEQAD